MNPPQENSDSPTASGTLAPVLLKHIIDAFPTIQALYLFGSYAQGNPWPQSDVDVAVLLPPREAATVNADSLSRLRRNLEEILLCDVDLINLRRVSTVFQKEIIMNGRRIHCADAYAAEEFEMLVLSYYQQLNEERAEILAEGRRSGRFYNV